MRKLGKCRYDIYSLCANVGLRLPVRGSLPRKDLVVESRFALFKNEDQWSLAMWALYPEPLSRPRLERAIEEVCFVGKPRVFVRNLGGLGKSR